MTQEPEQVMKELREGRYHPVYFLQGDEPYYIDSIAAYIENYALEESEKGFNQVVMYGKDSSIESILTNARRFPMMASRQVVIVREAQEIAHFYRADTQQLLQAYIERPLVSTILVFCYKYKTLDGRRALTRSITQKALLVECKKIKDHYVPRWIQGYVRSKNASIDQVTAQLLSDYIGNNLERLSSEVDKVLLNLKEPAKIDADTIQKYIGISKDYNVFELQKALAVKDNLKAQRIVQYFSANPKSNPIIPVIALLFSYFCKLIIVQNAGISSDKTLARELRIPASVVPEYQRAAGLYSPDQVMKNIGHLRTADLKVKGVGNVQSPPGEILKELIFKLMH